MSTENEKFKKILNECVLILLNKPSLEYFGILSYGLEKYGYDSKEFFKELGAAIPALAFTDGKKIVYWTEACKTHKDVLLITLHEMIHIISEHVQRCGSRDPMIWNVAADHVTNSILKELSQKNDMLGQIPTSNMVYFDDLAYRYPDASVEQIYDILLTQQKNKQLSCEMVDLKSPPQNSNEKGDDDSNSSGEGAGDDKDDDKDKNDDKKDDKDKKDNDEEKDDKETDNKKDSNDKKDDKNDDKSESKNNKKKNEKSKSSSGSDNGNGDGSGSGGNPFEGMKAIKVNGKIIPNDTSIPSNINESEFLENLSKIKENARSLWNSNTINKGNLPGNVQQYLDKINKIEIPWDIILNTAILYNVQCQKRKSWSYKNIYIKNPRLPGKDPKGLNTGLLIAVIDSSGSVCDDDLKDFIGVLLGSIQYYKYLKILVHDYSLNNEIDFKRGRLTEEDITSSFKKITGRGGTSHKAVFDRLEDINQEENISSIIFLTDYYSDVQHIYNNYKWIKTHDTIWVLNHSQILEVDLNGCRTKVINIK